MCLCRPIPVPSAIVDRVRAHMKIHNANKVLGSRCLDRSADRAMGWLPDAIAPAQRERWIMLEQTTSASNKVATPADTNRLATTPARSRGQSVPPATANNIAAKPVSTNSGDVVPVQYTEPRTNPPRNPESYAVPREPMVYPQYARATQCLQVRDTDLLPVTLLRWHQDCIPRQSVPCGPCM